MGSRIGTTALIAISLALAQGRAEGLPEADGREQILVINDRLVITGRDVEGTDASYRIDEDGTVTFPLVGKIRAEGRTVEGLERELTRQLATFIRSPQVSVTRLSARADHVVIAGAFKNPGVYPLSARRPVLDVVSSVGGLQPNVRRIRITRRLGQGHSSLPSAAEDPAAGSSVAIVEVARLMDRNGLYNNVLVEPQDVLLAETTGVVFLTGEVLRPGSFELGDKDSFALTELIALAGGLGRDAAPQKTKILRPILNGSRRGKISVNARSILAGQANDFYILPNDIVVVPRAGGKARVIRTALLYSAPVLVSALIYTALR